MRELHVETTEGLILRFELAGAGSRTAASLLDCLLLFIAFFFLGIFLALLSSIDPTGLSGFGAGLLAGGLLIASCAYQILFGVFRNGQTPGKSLLGLRVADAQGHSASWVQHALRGLFWPLEVLLLVPISLGILLIGATARHQRLGDLVAGTLVLRTLRNPEKSEPFPDRRWEGLMEKRLELSPALATRFDEHEIGWLRGFHSRSGIGSEARERILLKAGPVFLERIGVQPGRDPHQIDLLLRELYVFLREFGPSSGGGRSLPR